MAICLIYFHLFRLVIIALLLEYQATGLQFDTFGYEHCVFNVVKYDTSLDLRSQDLVEQIIVHSEGIQRWTILRTGIDAPYFDKAFLNNPIYLQEICSVNIVISIGVCYGEIINEVFSGRFYNPKNTFITVLGNINCGVRYYWSTDDVAPAFHFHVTSVTLITGRPNHAFSVCFICSVQYKYVKMSSELDLRKIAHIRKFSANIKTRSTLPVIALYGAKSGLNYKSSGYRCKYLYWERVDNNIPTFWRAGCNTEHIFMENAAEKLNVSLAYFAWGVASARKYFLKEAPKHFSAVSALDSFQFVESSVMPITAYGHIKVNSRQNKFLYCVKTKMEERESFRAFFWTVPLDSSSWTSLGISCIILVILLRGQWLPIYSILMRQPARVLNKKKWLTGFALAAIIFTYGYEGVIASRITVPPPIKVFKTLKELIDKGYKILGRSVDEHIRSGMAIIFQKENISALPSSAIVNGSKFFSTYETFAALAHCNTTVPALDEDTNYEYSLEQQFPGVKCHVASTTVVPHDTFYFFFGSLRQNLLDFAQRFKEAGLLNMYEDNNKHIRRVINAVRIREMDRLRIASFQISDPKIMSIFVGWAVLLGCSIFVFLVLEIILLKIVFDC